MLPHVFGEGGKPFYNSVVSTFCHQLSCREEPEINVDGDLELLHAQDVSRTVFEAIVGREFRGAPDIGIAAFGKSVAREVAIAGEAIRTAGDSRT